MNKINPDALMDHGQSKYISRNGVPGRGGKESAYLGSKQARIVDT